MAYNPGSSGYYANSQQPQQLQQPYPPQQHPAPYRTSAYQDPPAATRATPVATYQAPYGTDPRAQPAYHSAPPHQVPSQESYQTPVTVTYDAQGNRAESSGYGSHPPPHREQHHYQAPQPQRHYATPAAGLQQPAAVSYSGTQLLQDPHYRPDSESPGSELVYDNSDPNWQQPRRSAAHDHRQPAAPVQRRNTYDEYQEPRQQLPRGRFPSAFDAPQPAARPVQQLQQPERVDLRQMREEEERRGRHYRENPVYEERNDMDRYAEKDWARARKEQTRERWRLGLLDGRPTHHQLLQEQDLPENLFSSRENSCSPPFLDERPAAAAAAAARRGRPMTLEEEKRAARESDAAAAAARQRSQVEEREPDYWGLVEEFRWGTKEWLRLQIYSIVSGYSAVDEDEKLNKLLTIEHLTRVLASLEASCDQRRGRTAGQRVEMMGWRSNMSWLDLLREMRDDGLIKIHRTKMDRMTGFAIYCPEDSICTQVCESEEFLD